MKSIRFSKREWRILKDGKEAYDNELARIAAEALIGLALFVGGIVITVSNQLPVWMNGLAVMGAAILLDAGRSFLRARLGRKMSLEKTLTKDNAPKQQDGTK